MNHRIGLLWGGCFVVALLAGCSNERSVEITKELPAPAVPGVLTAAHQAYLVGDFASLQDHVRDVLLDPSSSEPVKENAYALLDKAFETQGGKLPSNYVPPAGFGGLQLAYRRFMSPHGPIYQVRFAGLTRDASHITGLIVRRLPDETLMDKAGGKGKFEIRHDPAARKRGLEEFVIDSEIAETLPDDGVVSLRIELDDGTVSEAVIVAHALALQTAPEILSPTSSESLADPNPLVRWAPFRAPDAAFELRRTVVHVTRDGESGGAWEFSTTPPTETFEVRLGSSAGSSEMSFVPGDYWLTVDAVESRYFGPIEVIRGSRIAQPFHVVR